VHLLPNALLMALNRLAYNLGDIEAVLRCTAVYTHLSTHHPMQRIFGRISQRSPASIATTASGSCKCTNSIQILGRTDVSVRDGLTFQRPGWRPADEPCLTLTLGEFSEFAPYVSLYLFKFHDARLHSFFMLDIFLKSKVTNY
jgi:hypothetical protein